MIRTIEGVFGKSTPFDEGVIEGIVTSVPLMGQIKEALRDENRGISQEAGYRFGKALGIASTTCVYIGYVSIISDLLLK